MNTTSARPVLVLTALDLEYQAVSRHLTGRRQSRQEGTIFEHGQLSGGGTVTLALIGEGNLAAAALAERARAAFAPRALLMTGIAGALKADIGLGDIVVATRIYAYHGGKEEGGEQLLRPRAWDADHALLQLAHHVSRPGSWIRYLAAGRTGGPPAVHFKPVAAGEVVLNSRDTPLARQLHRSFNDAAAIETESAGIAQAGALTRSLQVLRATLGRELLGRELKARAGGVGPAEQQYPRRSVRPVQQGVAEQPDQVRQRPAVGVVRDDQYAGAGAGAGAGVGRLPAQVLAPGRRVDLSQAVGRGDDEPARGGGLLGRLVGQPGLTLSAGTIEPADGETGRAATPVPEILELRLAAGEADDPVPGIQQPARQLPATIREQARTAVARRTGGRPDCRRRKRGGRPRSRRRRSR